MNKRDLIDALSGRLGDKKSATEALNAVLETIQSAVASGDKVAITGFGVFEKSERPARTARNPATGAEITSPRQSVPKFRPGADFKALVNGGPRRPRRSRRRRPARPARRSNGGLSPASASRAAVPERAAPGAAVTAVHRAGARRCRRCRRPRAPRLARLRGLAPARS